MLSLSVSIYASEVRDWQTVDGKEYKGAFLLLTENGNVQIYDDNSREKLVVLPLKSLCDEDQEYVRGQSNPFQIDDPASAVKKKEAEEKFTKIDWSTPIEVIMVDAERGNADALAYLGFCYETASKGLNYDVSNARYCHERGAKLLSGGSLGAKYCIAKLVGGNFEELADQGFLPAMFSAAGEKYLQGAAEGGIPLAQRLLADKYNRANDHKAAYWYQKAAENGALGAAWKMASLYENGSLGLKKDRIECIKWAKKAWSLGGDDKIVSQLVKTLKLPSDNAFEIFKSYLVPGNGDEAAEIFKEIRRQAESGDAMAQDVLGECYLRGIGGPKRSYEKAVEWFQKSAEQGNPVAYNDLGDCYWEGKGVKEDKEKALEYYHKAAEKGYYVRLQELGKNPAFGFDKLRNQAERGTAEDKYKLAMRFLYGDKDVPKDVREAIVWLKKAAYTDDSQWAADAAYQLGDLTENTKGYFEKLFTDGKHKEYWTNLAASKGHSGAKSWAGEHDIESRKRREDERNTRVLEEAIRRARK